jgi:hypothetical protein
MEKIIITARASELVDFLAMEDGIYKNILYNRDFINRQFIESDLLKTDDGKIYFVCNTYTIKKGKKYYIKNKSRKGFTLNEKGKLSIWFGSDIAGNPNFINALQALNIDWFINEGNKLWPFMTKTLFEKVITGKITNPIDFLSGYLKLSRINASPKLMYAACKAINMNKNIFLRGAYTAKDVNHYLEFLINNREAHHPHLVDLISQSKILERKIDFKWSAKRMDEEHISWTKEIMAAEISSIPDKTVSVNLYERIAPHAPEFFESLDTQKKVFMEGTLMLHCVYSNYWGTIDRGEYLAYHINWKGQEATLGLYIDSDKNKPLRLSQVYGKRNSPVSSELRVAVIEALQQLNYDLHERGVSLIKEGIPVNNEIFIPF